MILAPVFHMRKIKLLSRCCVHISFEFTLEKASLMIETVDLLAMDRRAKTWGQ
jgi:hypothetical protein